MLNQIDTQFDPAFQSIRGLTWLPWVGEAYATLPREKRLMVVGESHYYGPPDTYDTISPEPGFCRAVISKYAIGEQQKSNDLYGNLHRTLFPQGEMSRERFWTHSVFHNIVQKAMNWGDKQTPTAAEFQAGWPTLFELIRVLTPGHVLFLGNTAAEHIRAGLAATESTIHHKTNLQKIGRTYLKTAQVSLPGEPPLEMTFIQHPSSYFSPQQWHSVLTDRLGNLIM